MGNSLRKEPSRPASKSTKKLKPTLKKFHSHVPMEVQVYTMSFLPLSDISKIFLTNKLLYEQVRIDNQLFAKFYRDIALSHFNYLDWLPWNISNYKLEQEYLGNGYCENYCKIKQAVKNRCVYKHIEGNDRMNAVLLQAIY